MTTFRFKMIEEAVKRSAVQVKAPAERTSDYYGVNVFNREKMAKYLPKEIYDAVQRSVEQGVPLDRKMADEVAAAMKDWAMEMGATHYTHWFQPLTGSTAEKHDNFIELTHDGVIEKFSGKLLIQQEPDASSFPSGGIRSTFEARGYSAWDVTSPAFIMDDTLCIPTIFISYTGEALDYKTPLLKSETAINKAATAVCQYFDNNVKKITINLGWEQEYFLIDKSLYDARPDLLLTGRTLIGHESAKNQQLDDHYFGSIPTRVQAYMKDLEFECLKLGIPLKTRHNEVAPNQFEIAPIFETANLANDHNQLLMMIMKKTARRHNFRMLLHEKPFKGINGSGKHCNWSMQTNTGVNLLSPADNPMENLQFITFLVNVLCAVQEHDALLKASIISATNTHRLGGHEAPPAILSAFLGSQLSGILDKIESLPLEQALEVHDKSGFTMQGVEFIPELMRDNTDRNRTSPFAFTGNRFEFRAVGSSANCAQSMTVLNSIVAEQLVKFKSQVDALIAVGKPKLEAIYTVVKECVKQCKAIRFDGNGYSDEWKREANERGLDCETSVPLILDNYVSEKSVRMFESTNVFTRKELESRTEVYMEIYTKKVQIEGRVLGNLAFNHIIPAASKYQDILLGKLTKFTQLFSAERVKELAKYDMAMVEKISKHITAIHENVDAMTEARKVANEILDEREKALSYQNNVFPYFDVIRYHVDELEDCIDDYVWPMPKYRELLFIR
ncbi:MAG: glutamine synthetase type III [Bacteroidales bacterium]|nr:glutamine synthetase type III [Bacteroidales bacterium]